jgi:hypothetical protein
MNTECFSNGIPAGFLALFPDELTFLVGAWLTISRFGLFVAA